MITVRVHRAIRSLLILSSIIFTSCGDKGERQEAGETTRVPSTPQAGPSGTGAVSVALGDSIFHGLAAGGTCYTCHGADAKGTQLAPDLTDATWLHGDGSEESLVQTITNGVMTPKEHSSVMPPKGGAPLTDDQVRAVAMYVKSLGGGG